MPVHDFTDITIDEIPDIIELISRRIDTWRFRYGDHDRLDDALEQLDDAITSLRLFIEDS